MFTALRITMEAIASPVITSSSGIVAASSCTMRLARFSTSRTALFMRPAIRGSRPKALTTRAPVEVSCTTLMISPRPAISCAMIARTFFRIFCKPNNAAGPTMRLIIDRKGC